MNAFVSGPLSDTVRVRIAASQYGGGDWQRSATRSDSRGERDRTMARGVLEWDAGGDLKLTFMTNYWRDGSDSQALQFVRYSPLASPGLPEAAEYVAAQKNPRAAGWDIGKDFKLDIEMVQPSLRVDWGLSDSITLTSISAYSHYKTNSRFGGDGSTFEIQDVTQHGEINDFSQELRFSGETDRLNWVVGGSFQKGTIDESLDQQFLHLSNVQNIGGSNFSMDNSRIYSRNKVNAKAVFANAEFQVTDRVSLVAGGRYTRTKLDFRGCATDDGLEKSNPPVPGVTASARGFFNMLYGLLTGDAGRNPVQPGGCITLDNLPRDGNVPTYLPTLSPDTLKEDNFSWNIAANFKPSRNALVYARVAQGYKSGTYPTIAASASRQFLPAKQEGLLSYEMGFKLDLFDRRLHIDGAGFYYDYKDKQLTNFIPDLVFGPLIAVVNIPKSRVTGAELAIQVTPLDGLTLGGGATYVETKVTKFPGYDQNGNPADFRGAKFNFAPKWSATADLDYRWDMGDELVAFVGGGLTYHSKTIGIIGSQDPDYNIDAYTLLDLQAGVELDSGISARVWGKNVTNTYYWSNVNRIGDNIVRAAGMPATYGVTVGYKF